jgi:signal transduction histidine kinase
MHSPLIEWIRATSLRTRLTLWNTAVVILLTTVTLLIVRFSARSALYADCDAELRAASREIALAVQELSGDAAPLVAELRRKAASHEERGWFLHLLTPDGATVWKSDHCPADVVNYPPKDVEQVEVVRQVGHYRYVRNRIDRDSGPSYLVRVGTYTTGLDDSLAGLIRLLTGMGLGLTLITPFAAYWLAGRATQPMGAMLRTAERLSPSRLGDRLPVRGTSDELDLLARTINGLLDSVAQHVDKQEQFVADAAHELRGPLAALQSSMEVTLARDDLPPDQQETLSDMLEAARHLSKVANDMLLLAESGRPVESRHHVAVDLATVARQAVAMFTGVAEERGISLTVWADGPADACANPVDLRRMLSNLLDNAIRFTPAGGTVEVRAIAAGETALLTVTDTGVGIAPRDLDHVFDRFFKADPARTHGSGIRSGGLGLSICRSIAESCGGTIGITSRVGQGTTITVRLPAVHPLHPSSTPPEQLDSALQPPQTAQAAAG